MRLSFIIQFKIEFLLPFTGFRKVLEKKREYQFLRCQSAVISPA